MHGGRIQRVCNVAFKLHLVERSLADNSKQTLLNTFFFFDSIYHNFDSNYCPYFIIMSITVHHIELLSY